MPGVHSIDESQRTSALHNLERVIIMDDYHVSVIEFIAWHDAELSIDLKQCDRDHQGAGELECVGLGEGKIVRHLRAPPWSEADPRSMAPVSVLNRPRSPRRRSRSGRSLLADPLRVDRGRPGGGPGKPSKESGVGLAPKVVIALLHALFPDAEPQCRTGTHPVPPSASGRKDDFRALPKRSRRDHQFNRHGCEKPFRAASHRRRSPGPWRYPYANGARSSLFRPPPWSNGRTRRLASPGPNSETLRLVIGAGFVTLPRRRASARHLRRIFLRASSQRRSAPSMLSRPALPRAMISPAASGMTAPQGRRDR